MKRHSFFAVPFVLVMLLACNKPEATSETQNVSVLSESLQKRLQLATATQEDVQSQLQLTGKVSAYEEKLVKVAPLVDGIIERLNANLGDYVKMGQTLAVIKSADAASAENDLNDAATTLSTNEKNLSVAKDMAHLGLASQKDVILAENELKRAQGSVKRAEEVTSLYGIKNSLYTMKSPISGYVIEKNTNISNQLSYDNAQTGAFYTIADLSVVQVWANVYESDIAKIRLGQEVQIKILAFPNRVFTGKIDKIQDMIDPDTRTMRVRISIPNKDIALKPEMFAQVTVNFGEGTQMVSVPTDAVVFDNNRSYVVVYRADKHVENREVQVYRSAGNKTYIQAGLKPGEQVLMSDQLIVFNSLNQ
ncbi:MAG: efflux RND transporter periplasmic adaptor subunit [Spirosomataceae bacterium]